MSSVDEKASTYQEHQCYVFLPSEESELLYLVLDQNTQHVRGYVYPVHSSLRESSSATNRCPLDFRMHLSPAR
jgi:hypothetical protein